MECLKKGLKNNRQDKGKGGGGDPSILAVPTKP